MYEKCSIFVGNLAIFCTEKDIEDLFSQFGQILSISIKCDEATNKNLSYGFVKYSSEISALQAMKALNGTILCGRPLRIGKALKEKNKDKNLIPKPSALETSSIHVTYISYQIDKLVTEESLRAIFSTFGEVIDASIKKSTVDEVGNCQSGYGFVHYSNSLIGIESAFKAARSLYDVQIDNVNYICKISHALESHLKTNSFNPFSMDSLTTGSTSAVGLVSQSSFTISNDANFAASPTQQQHHHQQQMVMPVPAERLKRKPLRMVDPRSLPPPPHTTNHSHPAAGNHYYPDKMACGDFSIPYYRNIQHQQAPQQRSPPQASLPPTAGGMFPYSGMEQTRPHFPTAVNPSGGSTLLSSRLRECAARNRPLTSADCQSQCMSYSQDSFSSDYLHNSDNKSRLSPTGSTFNGSTSSAASDSYRSLYEEPLHTEPIPRIITTSSYDPFHQFNPKAFEEEEPACLHATSFTWSSSFLPSSLLPN